MKAHVQSLQSKFIQVWCRSSSRTWLTQNDYTQIVNTPEYTHLHNQENDVDCRGGSNGKAVSRSLVARAWGVCSSGDHPSLPLHVVHVRCQGTQS